MGAVPVLVMPCETLLPQYMIAPGPTGVGVPSTSMTPVPLATIMNSSSGWRCGGCGDAPGSSVHMPVHIVASWAVGPL